MQDTRYAYSVARVRAVENNLLSKTDIDMLLNAASLEEAVRILQDHGYSSEEGEETEKILSSALADAWNFIRDIAPNPFLFDALLYQNDFHNLKTILKGFISGSSYETQLLHPYTVEPSVIIQAVEDNQFDNLPDIMRNAAAEAFDVLTRTADGQLCDIIVDKAALNAIMLGGKRSGSAFFAEITQLICAFANIKTSFRAARTKKGNEFLSKALAENELIGIRELINAASAGEQGMIDFLSTVPLFQEGAECLKISISVFEKWCDNLLMDKARKSKYMAFGIEPLVAYLLAKENEIKTVRIILSGKRNNLKQEMIRERLRELYV